MRFVFGSSPNQCSQRTTARGFPSGLTMYAWTFPAGALYVTSSTSAPCSVFFPFTTTFGVEAS